MRLFDELEARRRKGELFNFDELTNRDLYQMTMIEGCSSDDIAHLCRSGYKTVCSRRCKLGYTKKGAEERGILTEIETLIVNYLKQSDKYKNTCLKIIEAMHPEFSDCGYRKEHDINYIDQDLL